MRARLEDVLERAYSSLWFLPGLLLIAGGALAFLVISIDQAFGGYAPAVARVLYRGTPEAARLMLATIAGSLISVMALTFSVLMLALSQASSQLTPRGLRTFMNDRGNQVVLGSFIGTFTYCLIALSAVPPLEEAFQIVPGLSVSVALVLTVWCLGLLMYFFHHSAQALQASTLLERVRQETIQQLEQMYPSVVGRPVGRYEEIPPPRPEHKALLVRSDSAGFLRRIDAERLLALASPHVQLVWVHARIGVYVRHRSVLAEVWADGPTPDGLPDAIREAFVFGRERTLRQDLLFGIKQMVDIALRALSPGVNDPTTAEYAISHLGDVLVLLADREFPARLRRAPGAPTLFWFERPSFADAVVAAFAQIRRTAVGNVHVTDYLLDTLAAVAENTVSPERSDAVLHEVREVHRFLQGSGFAPEDREYLLTKAEAILSGGGPDAVRRPGDHQDLPT